MAARNELLRYLIDQLSPLGDVRGRALFGGYGVYLDGLIIGIIAFDAFYLKVDEENRPDFEAAGAEPFSYEARGRRTIMAYCECPADVLEESERLRHWTLKALAASRRAKPATGRARRRRRSEE